jgi:hypothetical protein
MTECKIVHLNKGFHSRENDLKKVEEEINTYLSQGWTLLTVVSPNDLGGALVGIFTREK